MGLLKKRPEEEAGLMETPETSGDATIDGADEQPAEAGGTDAAAEATAPEVAEAPPPPAAPAADADALLQVFQDAQHEGEDRSMFLDMAGDVELADLMEELATTAAALGIVVGRAATADAADEMAA